MKTFVLRILLLLVLLASASIVKSQDKEITLESIYLKPEFLPEGAGSYNSMKDGNYYSSIDEESNINVYDYETSTLKNTLMKGSDFTGAIGNKKPILSVINFQMTNQEYLSQQIYKRFTEHLMWQTFMSGISAKNRQSKSQKMQRHNSPNFLLTEARCFTY